MNYLLQSTFQRANFILLLLVIIPLSFAQTEKNDFHKSDLYKIVDALRDNIIERNRIGSRIHYVDDMEVPMVLDNQVISMDSLQSYTLKDIKSIAIDFDYKPFKGFGGRKIYGVIVIYTKKEED